MITVHYPDGEQGTYNTLAEALWDIIGDYRAHPEWDLSEYLMYEDGFPIGAAYDHFKIVGTHVYPTQAMLDVMTRCVIRCFMCEKQGLT